MGPIEPYDDMERHPLEGEATSDLIKDLLGDAQFLMREEVRIAKLELQREAEKVKTAGKALAAGAVLGFIAAIIASFALVFLLSTIMAAWLAAAIVAVVLALAAVVATKNGINKFKLVAPTRAVAPIKEDGRWMKRTFRDIQSQRREPTLH